MRFDNRLPKSAARVKNNTEPTTFQRTPECSFIIFIELNSMHKRLRQLVIQYLLLLTRAYPMKFAIVTNPQFAVKGIHRMATSQYILEIVSCFRILNSLTNRLQGNPLTVNETFTKVLNCKCFY